LRRRDFIFITGSAVACAGDIIGHAVPNLLHLWARSPSTMTPVVGGTMATTMVSSGLWERGWYCGDLPDNRLCICHIERRRGGRGEKHSDYEADRGQFVRCSWLPGCLLVRCRSDLHSAGSLERSPIHVNRISDAGRRSVLRDVDRHQTNQRGVHASESVSRMISSIDVALSRPAIAVTRRS